MLFSIRVSGNKVNTYCAYFFMCYNKSMSNTYYEEEQINR